MTINDEKLRTIRRKELKKIILACRKFIIKYPNINPNLSVYKEQTAVFYVLTPEYKNLMQFSCSTFNLVKIINRSTGRLIYPIEYFVEYCSMMIGMDYNNEVMVMEKLKMDMENV